MIREDNAKALVREGIGQDPLAQVLDRVREAVVQDHRSAIAALVLEVHASSVTAGRRVRPRSLSFAQRAGTAVRTAFS